MVRYRRNFVPGGSYFFTVTLADRNEIDFERHVDYVHFNPVKHRLVNRACDWPYSSFHVYVRRGLLPADWAGDVEEPTMDFGERRVEARAVKLQPV
jgi:hypothetical protein